MEALGDKYKTYALDFWGFGESTKTGSHYTVSDYVEMVTQFMERLGLEETPVMGHSMGGTVSLGLALEHPERVKKVAVVGSPISGDGLAVMLKLAAKRPLAALAYSIPGALSLGVRLFSPFIARDWKRWYAMFEQDLSATTMESFHYSIASLRDTNYVPRLGELRVPVLGVYGRTDRIVNPKQGEHLASEVAQPQVAYFDAAGHFPMLDDPDLFHHTLMDFLDQPVTRPS
jgi:pimeloyl-ACP methyl ester carboxylesterase